MLYYELSGSTHYIIPDVSSLQLIQSTAQLKATSVKHTVREQHNNKHINININYIKTTICTSKCYYIEAIHLEINSMLFAL